MKLDESVFIINNFGPGTRGVWESSGNCDFEFPGYDIEVQNSGYIFTRFSVAIFNYQVSIYILHHHNLKL